MKPIIELVIKGGDPDKVVAVACGSCRLVRRDRRQAETCCDHHRCKHCGKITERPWLICTGCRAQQEAKKEREMFDAATKLTPEEYDLDYVCLTPYGGEGEYRDTDELEDLAEDHAYVWACVPQPWPHLDALDILTNALEEFHEHAIDQLDVSGLQRTIEEWWKAQGESRCHIADKTRVIILDPERCP